MIIVIRPAPKSRPIPASGDLPDISDQLLLHSYIYIEFRFSLIVNFIAIEAKYTQAGLLFPKAVLRVDTYMYIN